ncbi:MULTISPECIES: hypothetical protein [Xenorhabdus]|uniref:Uncharacterized protein n=1 Tax=Xenorhabdus ehlersii TaxID=290111 RepID=A0A2D0IVV3_9GAMM|nr:MULTISPECIES: hypothetical protein [Xenorhabdus]MBC8949671.1 hypothetical protein [Xenorhabdus sp. TS4]PHM26039.1 hypothetical protein Xehl_01101 [Xenorhabdus ehlersii]RKE88595.1 hypothetical protein BDE27_3235 [Xenorhabdus ehlersii]
MLRIDIPWQAQDHLFKVVISSPISNRENQLSLLAGSLGENLAD